MARRAVSVALLGALLALGIALAWPRPAEFAPRFDAARIGGDVDAYLAASEAAFDDIRPGEHKRILWHGAAGDQTALSIVYLHGFSASPVEGLPVTQLVAEALGANLVLTRLAGHGRDGPAMAEARLTDWADDVAEALAIARRIGQRVVVIGTSTGGTLAALAAADAQLSQGVAGVVLVSPNFRPADPNARFLTWPLARWWVPLIAGPERSWTPRTPAHDRHWTHSYPTVALLPMARAVQAAAALDPGGIQVPALVMFDPDDQVVDHDATQAVMRAWGGGATRLDLPVHPGDDPARHVLIGDALSPNATQDAVAGIVAWVRGL